MLSKNLIFGIILIFICVGIVVIIFNNPNIINSDSENGTITITDIAGREVKIPSKINKVVGFNSVNREISYLNSSDKIVGIEKSESFNSKYLPYMVANPRLANLTVLGSSSENLINYEKLLEVHPDVVFVDSVEKANTIETKTNIPAVVVYEGMIGTNDQMDNYTNSLKLIGKILDKQDRANELVNYIGDCHNDFEKRSKIGSNKTVYVGGHAYRGAHGIRSTNAYYPSFIFLHLNNVASSINNTSESSNHAIEIGKEQLVNWNPDVVFIESSSLFHPQNDTINNLEYSNISAVKKGQVYTIFSYCWFYYNKEEMLSNSYYIGKVMYPDQFSDVDIENKTNEIFMKFLGKPIYKELTNNSKFGYAKLDI